MAFGKGQLEVESTGEPMGERASDGARGRHQEVRDTPDLDETLPGTDEHDEHERHERQMGPSADEGTRRAPDALQLEVHRLTRHGSERAEGLIHQEQRGIVDECPRQRDALPHPPRIARADTYPRTL